MKTPPTVSNYLSVCLCLLFSYALLISTVTPFGPRTVQAYRTQESPANKSEVSFTSTQAQRRDGELLVRFRAGVAQQNKETVLTSHGTRTKKQLRGESQVEKLELLGGQDPEAVAQLLRLQPEVEFAEPNFLVSKDDIVTSDPRFDEQWALRNTGQNGGQFGSDINVSAAWQKTTGSQATVIAVIDSGIDFSHPDLSNNQWTNPTPGAAGDVHGWDYVTETGDVKDEQGHGTAIAGIIAAQGNNALGISGVMWHASLMNLRVLDNTGTGDIGSAVEAIDYAVAHGAQVINISWGTTGESLALKDAIERAIRRGVVVVCSAGNGGQDVDAVPYYPASFGLRDLVSVAATDNFDQLTTWSNWGQRNVTVAAPGVNILTTKNGGGYWNVSGTSASAPLVAGVAGLIKSLQPTLNAHNVVKALTDQSRSVASLSGKVSSSGLLNASASLNSLHGSPNPPHPFPTHGYGSGGNGPGGSFNTTPPAHSNVSPASGLPDLNQLRNTKSKAPKVAEPIQSNLLACADCDPESGGGGATYHPSSDPNFSSSRELPRNETGQAGVDLGSQNFNWSQPIVGLPGRAGLDLNLTLFYNSLVWTKDGGYIKYNADLGSPAPGFRLGLPILQQRFSNAQTGVYAYLMVTPSGGRVEMRQQGSSNIYESQDGSYTQLDVSDPNTFLVRTTDGTQYNFIPVTINNEYRCNKITDRNGNYISATYDTTTGHLQTVTDTLGRELSFLYDTNNNLERIRQTWAGGAHDWATFNYGEVHVAPGFSGLLVNGPSDNYVTVLTRVNLQDGSYFTFDYNQAFGQVNRINRHANDNRLVEYTSYNVSSSAGQTDCPRFTERRDWAENWNNNSEAVTTYSLASDGSSSQQTSPDGTIYKEFFATSGWRNGLTTSSEVWSSGVKQKWTTTGWTQDDENLSYQKNPRVTETNIYDADGNRKRVTINYGSYSAYSLPYEIIEYAADGATMLRRTYTDYYLDANYVAKRIIGMVSAVHVVDHATGAYLAKTTYDYDWGGEYLTTTSQTATHHLSNNTDPTTRGNLVRVLRWDVTDLYNSAKALPTTMGYNATGSVVFTRDGLGHQASVSYSDSFSDANNSRNTFAYPTTVTDPDGFASTAQYNFDFGAVTRTQGPPPAGQSQAAIQTMTYDSATRIEQVTTSSNSHYTRYDYGTTYVQSNSNVNTLGDESYSFQIFDGAGRVIMAGGLHPGSQGPYRAQATTYDVMGRVASQSNPTETNGTAGAWQATGDDSTQNGGLGWVSTLQTYDWKGRPRVTTFPDGATRENTYGGCGCAGGEVTTTRDERGRRRKATMDVLGRLKQLDELNWDQSVYATTSYSYNARDQITSINQAGQTRTLAYDVYGRLSSKTTPEQGTTNYNYFADDTVQTMTDARGASRTFTYNNRHQPLSITYGVPAGVAATPNVSFTYDAAGNRTSMTDGLGSVSYAYDQLSQVTSETRTFTELIGSAYMPSGSVTLSYSYNRAGELTSLSNPWNGVQVGYNYDTEGRPNAVTGSGYAGVSSYVNSIAYRAFGVKQMAYGNSRTLSTQYDNRMRMSRWDVPGVMGWEYNYSILADNSFRVSYAHNLNDATLDRSYDYDHLGRLQVAHTGAEARAHVGLGSWGTQDGPYSHHYDYDQFGNLTFREGWGGTNPAYSLSYTNNRLNAFGYDATGNLTDAGGGWTFTYDAEGQQASSAAYNVQQYYDGDRLRGKKNENGAILYYLRSTVLGGQVVAEVNQWGGWNRGYVYLGSQLVAIQYGGVSWVHQDPVTKSQRITNGSGAVTSTIDLDPWGGETNRSSNEAFQPRKFTSYERDVNGDDDAMNRRYNRWWSRFEQPDPYDGSYNLANPQSFNRYAYTQNDPVNFVDPTGLDGETFPIICFNGNCTAIIPGVTVHAPSEMLGAVFGGGTLIRNPINDFGGRVLLPLDPIGGDGGVNLQNSPQTTLPAPKPPCVHSGSGQADFNVSAGKIIGPTGGGMVTANRVYPYAGLSAGVSVPNTSGSITVANGTPTPGLNYSISIGSVIGFQYSGRLDLHHIRSSLKNGNLSFGGTLPNASVSIVWVGNGFRIPCL